MKNKIFYGMSKHGLKTLMLGIGAFVFGAAVICCAGGIVKSVLTTS